MIVKLNMHIFVINVLLKQLSILKISFVFKYGQLEISIYFSSNQSYACRNQYLQFYWSTLQSSFYPSFQTITIIDIYFVIDDYLLTVSTIVIHKIIWGVIFHCKFCWVVFPSKLHWCHRPHDRRLACLPVCHSVLYLPCIV